MFSGMRACVSGVYKQDTGKIPRISFSFASRNFQKELTQSLAGHAMELVRLFRLIFFSSSSFPLFFLSDPNLNPNGGYGAGKMGGFNGELK